MDEEPIIRKHWGEFEDDAPDTKKSNSGTGIIFTENQQHQLTTTDRQVVKHHKIAVPVENGLVTQTLLLTDYTSKMETLLEYYREGMVQAKDILHLGIPPRYEKHILSPRPKMSPFEQRPDTRFTNGLPMPSSPIQYPAARPLLKRAVSGLLCIKQIETVSTQVLETFVSVAEEFYRGLFDRMNQLEFLCRQEVQKKLDIKILSKAYHEMTHTSVLELHNYYNDEIIVPHRKAVIEFKKVHKDYLNTVEAAVPALEKEGGDGVELKTIKKQKDASSRINEKEEAEEKREDEDGSSDDSYAFFGEVPVRPSGSALSPTLSINSSSTMSTCLSTSSLLNMMQTRIESAKEECFFSDISSTDD